MELEIERSVEDNELFVTEGSERNGEVDAKLKTNGNCDTENVDGKLLDDVKDEVGVGKMELELLPAMKGKGLRKWRRIRRESGNETHSYLDGNRKRGMVTLPVVMKQKSEDSNSSTNAVSNVIGTALDHVGQYRDFGSSMGPDFVSRADSENSEDRNSRSSTAASAPRMNHELLVLGLGFGKDAIRNLSGMNTGISVQSDRQEKSRNVTKKARGSKVKKENSISSMESDSRSSNFVFMQGSNSITSNGRSGRSRNYEEDDSDDDLNGDKHLNDEVGVAFSKNEADSEYVSHEDLAGENSWEVKEEKADDHVESGNQDDLVDSIMPLHLAQGALAREVQKLRDVGKEETSSSDDCVEPSGSSFFVEEFQTNLINEVELQSKLEEASVLLDLKNTKISQLESTLNDKELKTEFEVLLTQRIAAELEYLVIIKTIENLKEGPDRTNNMVQQKSIAAAAATPPEQVQIEDAGEMKEDSWKLKNKLYRYAYCFMIQSVLFLVVLYMCVLQFLPKTVDVIPT